MTTEELKQKIVPKRVFYLNPKPDDLIDNLIIDAEKIRNPNAQFSHVAFSGDDGNVYESTIHISLINWQDGIKVSPLPEYIKRLEKSYDYVGVQELPTVTEDQWRAITESAKTEAAKTGKDKIHYAVLELFGTLIILVQWKFWGLLKRADKQAEILRKKNPFDSGAIYCISFVDDRFDKNKIIYCDPGINESQLIVDDGWETLLPQRKEIINL